MIKHYELIEKVRSYIINLDEELLNKAYVFAMQAHGNQKRISGDPYFSHPLEVASILADLKVDQHTIIAALLHDTVEDTEVTLKTIHKLFGAKIALLVDGVTKLSKVTLQSELTRKAENFKKLVLAMSSDMRVLLIKLADRLHNMRTIHYVDDEEKRKRISYETIEIYAPFAERIGMQKFKDELENLAFSHINSEMYESIKNRLIFLHTNSENSVETIIKELESILKKDFIKAQVFGRLKTPYSIWMKMKRKNITFSQLSDIMAFRIIVKNVKDCYQTLGLLHCNYLIIPGRFKDYISLPKANQYQALHTCIMGPLGYKIELQIKTEDMNHLADVGVAAHWKYKQGNYSNESYGWMKSLLEILDHASTPEEFFEHSKLEMHENCIFAFTPKGDLITLPKGSSIIDFAYAIHSSVGTHTVEGRINGVTMPLRTIIKNGDQVEILTNQESLPSSSWQDFVVTGKAIACIKKSIRNQQRLGFLEKGRKMLQKECIKAGIDYCEDTLKQSLNEFQIFPFESLLIELAEGHHTPNDILSAVYPNYKSDFYSKVIVTKNKKVYYAKCCYPIPFEQVIAVYGGDNFIVHRVNCKNVLENINDHHLFGWDELDKDSLFMSRLRVVFANSKGSLARIAKVVGDFNSNICNIKILQRTKSIWDVFLDIEVKDIDHLESIKASLRTLSTVSSIERI